MGHCKTFFFKFSIYHPKFSQLYFIDNAAIHHDTGALLISCVLFDFMPCEQLFAQTNNYIRENDVAWKTCPQPGINSV